MGFGVDGIVSASMSMSQERLEMAYGTAMMKKSMDNMESQAMSLINDMMGAVPPPSEYNFDVYG
ncbi:MAG: YjfB family protein [Oscillospiraceae bacterium]|nr:YjfB family protein [Oscillospiraceae bacterium]